jgi:hypothetical protein
MPTFRNTLSTECSETSEYKIQYVYLLAYEDGTECSETSAYKIQYVYLLAYEDGTDCSETSAYKIQYIYLLAYEDGTDCSEKSAYKIRTPGNYPEENIQQEDDLYLPRPVFVLYQALKITIGQPSRLSLVLPTELM